MGSDKRDDKMDLLWVHLDREATTPLYEQLYLHVKKEITAGRIDHGTKLPSKRKLAEFLKVSQNTVESTYNQLVAEGYVEVLPRKGFFVQAYEQLDYAPVSSKYTTTSVTELSPIRFNFHPTHIDTRYFPFDKWRKYVRQVVDPSNQQLLLLGNASGDQVFRQEIANYLYHSRGVQCTWDQIVIGAGMETLVQQLFLLFGKKSVYGIEDPGYQLMRKLLRHHPHDFYPFTVDEEGVDVQALTQSPVTIMYTTPSHHFPYGAVLSVNRRQQLLKWAEEKTDRFIIEDDYDSEFRYSGKTIPSLQSMDKHHKVIYVGSFSKSLIPSARLSYMVLPQTLVPRYNDLFSFHHSTVSRIDQHVLTLFMRAGDFEKHVNRMRKLYRRKRDIVLQAMKPYENQLSIIGERSGLHIVVVIKNGMSEEELVQAANDVQVKVYPLSHYTIEQQVSQHPRIVLGFASIPEEQLEEAVTTVLQAWKYTK